MEEREIVYSRSKVRFIFFVLLLVSYGVTSAVVSFVNPNYKFCELPGMLLAFFQTRETLLIFPVIFLIVGLAIGNYLNKEWNEEQREDLLGRGFRHAKGDQTYGAAHFLRPDEYVDAAQIRRLEDCKGIIVGQLKDNGEECVDFNPYEGRINSHMLAIGRSGGGKTFTFVLSFVFQAVKRRHSIIVTDPKGDLYMQCAGYLRDNGYVVRTLNLKDPSKSDGWDLLAALEGPRLEENAGIFSHTLAVNMSKEEGGIYVDAGESLINALILKTLLDPNNGPEDRKITTAYNMLLNPDGIAYLDTIFAEDVITEAEKPAQTSYLAFKNSSPNLLGNIITHVTVGLKLFQRKDICEMFTTPGIDMTLPGKQPCAYFIQFPDVHTTYSFLTALFFSMLFTYLVDYADLVEDRESGKKLGKLLTPVDFLLDEFPSIGTLPDWDSKMAVMRSRKINIVMIIQDYPQLVKRYESSWKTIVNNCGCILTLGINEPDDTASWISQRCGTATVEVQSSNTHSVAGVRKDQLIQNMSEGLGKRALLNVDEVCTVDRDGSIVIITDHGAVYVHKFPYILFPDSEKLYDTLPSDVVSISDRAGRKLFEAAETAYLEEYWSTHDMHPDLNISDLSDAKYVEPPAGPYKIAFVVLRDDIRRLVRAIKKMIRKRRVEKYVSSARTPDLPYVFESAQKGAFRDFYNRFKAEHENEFSTEVSSAKSALEITFEDSDDIEPDFSPDVSSSGPEDDIDLRTDSIDEWLRKEKQQTGFYSSSITQPKPQTGASRSNKSTASPTSKPGKPDKAKQRSEKEINKKRNNGKPEFNFNNININGGGTLPEAFKRN